MGARFLLSLKSSCLRAPVCLTVKPGLLSPSRSALSQGQRWAEGGKEQRAKDTEVLPFQLRDLSPGDVTQ